MLDAKNPDPAESATSKANANGSASAIGEFSRKVCRYFLDFLESDFKRTQAPRRRIQLKNEAGFRTTVPLRKYPTLADALWRLAQRASGEGLSLNIAPRPRRRMAASQSGDAHSRATAP